MDDFEVNAARGEDRRRLRRLCVVGAGVAVGLAASSYWYLMDRSVQLTGAAVAAAQPRTGQGAQQVTAVLQEANLLENTGADPGPQVLVLSDLGPDEARRWNASNPLAKGPNPPAEPFFLRASDQDTKRAVQCLTAAVYYEAAGEAAAGQRAVAQVVLNRLRHAAFPKTVCGVVLQGAQRQTGCQFTFTCDGSLARAPDRARWAQAQRIAVAALNGHVEKRVGNATHYHADYVAPYWSPTLLKAAVVGTHIFYRWTGDTGLPSAFFRQYVGDEPFSLQQASLLTSRAALALPEQEIVVTETDEPIAALPPERATVEAAQPVEEPADVKPAENRIGRPELDWLGRPRESERPRIAVAGHNPF